MPFDFNREIDKQNDKNKEKVGEKMTDEKRAQLLAEDWTKDFDSPFEEHEDNGSYKVPEMSYAEIQVKIREAKEFAELGEADVLSPGHYEALGLPVPDNWDKDARHEELVKKYPDEQSTSSSEPETNKSL